MRSREPLFLLQSGIAFGSSTHFGGAGTQGSASHPPWRPPPQLAGWKPGGHVPASSVSVHWGAGPPQHGWRQYWVAPHVALPHANESPESPVGEPASKEPSARPPASPPLPPPPPPPPPPVPPSESPIVVAAVAPQLAVDATVASTRARQGMTSSGDRAFMCGAFARSVPRTSLGKYRCRSVSATSPIAPACAEVGQGRPGRDNDEGPRYAFAAWLGEVR
jgi:hypothetical protein